MKYLNSPFFYISIFLFASFSVQAKDHKPKLHEMGNRIKQAVKSGKISEEEGWEKWRAVQRQHAHHKEVEYKHDADDWDDIDELEHEIEIRAIEFELERMEQDHEFERLKWEHQMERMQHDFDRERKEWAIHDMQLHARMELMKKEIGNHLRREPNRHMESPPDILIIMASRMKCKEDCLHIYNTATSKLHRRVSAKSILRSKPV